MPFQLDIIMNSFKDRERKLRLIIKILTSCKISIDTTKFDYKKRLKPLKLLGLDVFLFCQERTISVIKTS